MAAPQTLMGYPYRATVSWTPVSSQLWATMIIRGDEGKVLTEVNSDGWIKVSIGNTGRQGWVPRGAIEVGRTRLFGDRQFIHDFPQAIPTNLNLGNIQGTGIFEKSLRALGVALKTQRTNLPFLSDRMRNMLNNDVQREGHITQLLKDMDPDYLNIMNNPNATINQITTTLRPVVFPDTRVGYYLRVTRKFKGKPDKTPEVYIGKTQHSFYERLKAHRNPPPVDTSMAATSVRESQYCDAYPICLTTGNAIYTALCEQLLILVTGSYGHLVMDFIAKQDTSSTATMQSLVKEVSLRRVAKLLHETADAAFKVVGWTPPCQRPGFGASGGLNYASPIRAEIDMEKLLWIKTEQPGVKQTFHRSSCTVINTAKQRVVEIVAGWEYAEPLSGTRPRFKLTFRKGEDGPSNTVTEVYPVFEIQLNGPHPIPYARLPDVGPFADWETANRLGLRLEWQENGQWFTRYYQKYDRIFMRTNETGCLRGYAEGMGIIRYLQQLDQENPRGWFITFGLARVKQLSWDHLNQTAHLREVAPSGNALAAPRRRTVAQIVNQIRNLGGLGVDGDWRSWPLDGSMTPQNTNRKCDACYAAAFYSGTTPANNRGSAWGCARWKEDDGTFLHTCSECHMRGIFCSWTPTPSMPIALIAGLNYKEYVTPEVIPIALDCKRLDLT